MIQNQTKISIKDNSGLLLGRCINAGKQGVVPTLGQRVKVTVLKSKAVTKRKGSKRGALQDLLLIQTKTSNDENNKLSNRKRKKEETKSNLIVKTKLTL